MHSAAQSLKRVGRYALLILVTLTVHAAQPSPAADEVPNQAEISRYETLVQREPGNVEALVKLADLLYANYRAGEAVPLWKKALSLNPHLAKVHWSLGVVYWERGDVDAAKSEYLQALAVDPDFSSARVNLAVIYRDRHQLDEAEAQYRAILKRQPAAGNMVHSGLGQILAEQKRWPEAIEEYRADLLDSSNTSAYGIALTRVDLAEALRNTGNLDEADKEIGQALAFLDVREEVHGEVSWRPSATVMARANLELARIRARQGRTSESIGALAQAIGWNSALLEQIESTDDLQTVRSTARYRKAAAAARAGREDALEARFTAKVQSIEMLGEHAATVAAAERDAHWLLAIQITDIQESSALFDKPGRVYLAVHSPARLLARSADTALGKTYRFRLNGEVRDGKPVYNWMEAREAAGD